MEDTFQIWISAESGHPRAPLPVKASDTIDNVKQLCLVAWWIRGHTPRSSFSLHYPAVRNVGLAGTFTIGQLGIRPEGTIIIKADLAIAPEQWMIFDFEQES